MLKELLQDADDAEAHRARLDALGRPAGRRQPATKPVYPTALREEDCYYVDKTGFIARLLDEGSPTRIAPTAVARAASHSRRGRRRTAEGAPPDEP